MTSFDTDPALPAGFLAAAGFRNCGPRAVRLDILERLEDELSAAANQGLSADETLPRLLSLLGCDRPTLEATLAALGWRRVDVTPAGGEDAARISVWRQPPLRGRSHRSRSRRDRKDGRSSPFARLARLIAAD